MPIQTACPKCKKTYNLADSFLGKTVKCQACATPFLVKVAPEMATANRPGPGTAISTVAAGKPAADLSPFGLDGPIVRKSTDIFSGVSTPTSQGDPLANHVVSDPGFFDASAKKKGKTKKKSAEAPVEAPPDPAKKVEKTGDHPVFENPFLASTAALRKPPKHTLEPEAPTRRKGISPFRKMFVGSIAVALGGAGITTGIIRGLPEGSGSYQAGYYTGLAVSALLVIGGMIYMIRPAENE